MKLYARIERNGKKQVKCGDNESLRIKLYHSIKGKEWTEGMKEIELIFEWNAGKPRIAIDLPPKYWKMREGCETIYLFELVEE